MVVVDTNVFISQLAQVRSLVDSDSYSPRVIVYIPWSVLRELDILKARADGSEEKEGLRKSARDAINFIHKLLVTKNKRVRVCLNRMFVIRDFHVLLYPL